MSMLAERCAGRGGVGFSTVLPGEQQLLEDAVVASFMGALRLN
ncbi:hypothetical protein RBB79_07360 [Tunturiibacter empetritectus]|uniref:Uncharacterized protein n=2 Tax=Tunturiibacter TaxID=3154218 RepID=A0A852VFY2_9BACT|nr:hypothetical protein [Edaphobacter lichenicola]NYF89354.1 hypothetical protein [Edaphobacter lichenicola]